MLNTPNREDILHGVAELDDDRSRGMDAKRRGDWEVALFGTPTPAQCTLLVQDMAAEGWGSGGKCCVGGRQAAGKGFISLYLATHGGGRRDNGREGGRAGRPAHTATHALLKLVYCEVLQGLLLVALQDLAAS
ncbi:hypothetical protein B0H10DRAFT_1963628 [Mycena sp. CBHHK59/15]|nr:hypothetical protein B0H10DRAFT_1963628 [Mycena sp. CBHHK59/15]